MAQNSNADIDDNNHPDSNKKYDQALKLAQNFLKISDAKVAESMYDLIMFLGKMSEKEDNGQ